MNVSKLPSPPIDTFFDLLQINQQPRLQPKPQSTPGNTTLVHSSEPAGPGILVSPLGPNRKSSTCKQAGKQLFY